MRTIDVCFTPDLMHLYNVPEHTVVVVDILRATSCMVTAFAHGVEAIAPFSQLDDCRAMKSKGYLTTGERDGMKVDNFDLGNSPLEYLSPALKGKRIAFTTTNGTHAIVKALGAKQIVIGAFLNLSAVTQFLSNSSHNILIVCAGWKGKFNLEDTLFAGAVVQRLAGIVQPACDAPQAAAHLYDLAKNDMVKFLGNSSHVKRLTKLNIHNDIRFCLTPDQYDVVPLVTPEGDIRLGR